MSVDNLSEGLQKHAEKYIGLEGGYKLFHVAPPEVISAITSKEPDRVKYFPTSDWWQKYMKERANMSVKNAEPLPTNEILAAASAFAFRGIHAKSAAQEMARGYPGRALAIRGGATYLSDSANLVLPDETTLYNPLNALTMGREKSGRIVATHPLEDLDDPETGINLQNFNWLMQHPLYMRGALEKGGRNIDANKVFPLLMLFDNENPSEPKILQAAIFDYPILSDLIAQSYRT